MDLQQYKELYVEKREPDERQIALHERLSEYYASTAGLDNHQAIPHCRAFCKWRKDFGITDEEYNQAKRAYFGDVGRKNKA